MTRILAIDQGTTSTRAFLAEPGSIRLLLALPHRQIHPAPGRVEHDPAELLANLRACLNAGAQAGAVAVALANQGESCLAWDAQTGAALSPVIVWQDDRTAGETERLKATGAEALTLARAGLPLDAYFSASKLGWLLREVPEAAALARQGRLRLGTTDAFFRQALGGQAQTDAATASRTSLMHLGSRNWDDALCALFGVPPEALPPIGASLGGLGRLGPLPLVAAIVDQQAALFGHGARAPGAAKITFGTGAFALAIAGPQVPQAQGGLLPTLAWEDAQGPVYALDGGVYAASSAVNWARGLGLFNDFNEIDSFAGPPAIASGLAFIPALAGLACPHWDRAARGAWTGIAHGHGRAALMQALLEGVALRTGEVMAAMEAEVPLAPRLSIDGGMSRNGYFTQFLASRLGRPLFVSTDAELTARGLAEMAAQALGIEFDLPRNGVLVEPAAFDPAWTASFTSARQAVQRLGRH